MSLKLILVLITFQNILCQSDEERDFYTNQPWAPINALPPRPLSNCSACACNCDCQSPISNPRLLVPPTCPPCTGVPSPPASNVTIPTNGVSGSACAEKIRAASKILGSNIGSIVGAIVSTLLSNLVDILRLVLAGNNTIGGSVLPLVEIVCYLLGLVLILLQSIGALGVLGSNGLLESLLSALSG